MFTHLSQSKKIFLFFLFIICCCFIYSVISSSFTMEEEFKLVKNYEMHKPPVLIHKIESILNVNGIEFNDSYYGQSMYNKIYDIFINIYLYILIHNLLSYLFIFLICLFSTFLIINKNPMYSVICLILVYFSASFFLVFLEINFLAVIVILVYLGAVVVLFLFVIMMLNIKIQEKTKILTFFPFLIIFVCISFFSFSKFGVEFNFNDTSFKSAALEFNNFRSYSSNIKLNYFFTIKDLSNENIFDYKVFVRRDLDYISMKEIQLCESSAYIFKRNIILNNVNSKEFFLLNINYFLENFKILAFILYTHFFLDLIISAFVLLVAMLGCISLTLTSDSSVLKKQDSMVQILHKNSILLKKNK